jgi:hypothetical protein
MLSLEFISRTKITLQKTLCGKAEYYDAISRVKHLDIWMGGSGRLFNDVASAEASSDSNIQI